MAMNFRLVVDITISRRLSGQPALVWVVDYKSRPTGIFAADSKNKEGRSQVNPLYLKKYKLNYGEHTITVIVKGKPVRLGIDPYSKLIDRNPNDNVKDL
jgi:hypothetical protein